MNKPNMTDAFRAFIALPLPRMVLDHLSGVQQCLATKGIRARWVRPEGIHLTLKFLGHLAPEKVEAVVAALDRVAAHHTPLQLTTLGLGGFPNIGRPRVLWVGIGGESAHLGRLHQAIEAGLLPLGWPAEKRSFRGHLTLARAKGQRPFERHVGGLLAQCEPYQPVAFVADKLTLYRSHLRPEGAVYDKISQRVLSGGAP
jgi:2'-5' RNA ligase